jgi:predicted nucleotidyltransferase
MRIIGYIEHPSLKITVFKMDNRLSVKFETGLYEQTYKYRIGDQMESLEDVKKQVDEELLQQVDHIFTQMHQAKNQALKRNMDQGQDDEFDVII